MEVSGRFSTSGKESQVTLNRRLGGPRAHLDLLGVVRYDNNMIRPLQERPRINERGKSNLKVHYSVHSSPLFIRIVI
jgi:hypothetical protein